MAAATTIPRAFEPSHRSVSRFRPRARLTVTFWRETQSKVEGKGCLRLSTKSYCQRWRPWFSARKYGSRINLCSTLCREADLLQVTKYLNLVIGRLERYSKRHGQNMRRKRLSLKHHQQAVSALQHLKESIHTMRQDISSS